jgi:hypothetical protein
MDDFAASAAGMAGGRTAPANAIVTASYAADLDRCRLLCETVDRHVSGFARHYLLVEPHDVPLFRQLEGPRRIVVDERDILPGWLRSYRDPTSLLRRRIWLSLRTKPLRGWHVQQLRRIAIARHVGEDALVYCDSDVAFLKDFDCGIFWRDGRLRLFRRDGALATPVEFNHRLWSHNAAVALGIPGAAPSLNDYIATLISWRRQSVVDMCALIEKVHGRHWVEAVASTREFSECMLYGRYVDDVADGAAHFHGDEEYCRVYWYGPEMSEDAFRSFLDGMSPEQVAICMQSFIGTDTTTIRRLVSAG